MPIDIPKDGFTTKHPLVYKSQFEDKPVITFFYAVLIFESQKKLRFFNRNISDQIILIIYFTSSDAVTSHEF